MPIWWSKLATLADGDIDLVQFAVLTVAKEKGTADLSMVVDFIVQKRRARLPQGEKPA
jgi:hypothetical protein